MKELLVYTNLLHFYFQIFLLSTNRLVVYLVDIKALYASFKKP